MNQISNKDVSKLINEPLSYALMMDNEQIEELIATLVAVLNKRTRGDQNTR